MNEPTEERVARYMAAEDYLIDDADAEVWWDSRVPRFREHFLASARRVIAIVREGDR